MQKICGNKTVMINDIFSYCTYLHLYIHPHNQNIFFLITFRFHCTSKLKPHFSITFPQTVEQCVATELLTHTHTRARQ